MTRDQAVLWIAFAVPILLGIVACTVDVRERRIPNWISVALFASGMIFHVAVGGLGGLAFSIGGFAVGFVILFVLYAIGGGGAGDVKFMGGVGAWIGAYHTLFVFVISAILMALFVLSVLFLRTLFPSRAGESPARPQSETRGERVGGQREGPGLEDPRLADQKGQKMKGIRMRTPLPYAVPATVAVLLRLLWLVLIHRTL